jgi:histidyl-tRNA synthetase
MLQQLAASGVGDWCDINLNIARGLAYYTGMVFEVHEATGAERAIAGGGRYDNLIETFGGPATPSVGFGMGDVVLSLVLGDRGLMPTDAQILDILSQPPASYRPEVFVLSNGQPESDAAVRPLVARLRRGAESQAWLARPDRKPWDTDRFAAHPMHARHTYKTTKNIGKLLKEAADQRAKFAVIIESAGEATIKNLATGQQDSAKTPIDQLVLEIGARLRNDGSKG